MSEAAGREMQSLAWDHGVVSVSALGGMIGPTAFLLPDGRAVSPFHTAPWVNEPDSAELPGLMSNLRGEWPCVPFGYPIPSDAFPAGWPAEIEDSAEVRDAHGYGSNAPWQFEIVEDGAIKLFIDYPMDHAIRRLERTIRPDPTAPALNLTLTVHSRRASCEPIGLHACFRLPKETGRAQLDPGAFALGRTHPLVIEPAAPIFQPNNTFKNLQAVPGSSGETLDATRLPFAANGEDLLQLDKSDGHFGILYEAEDFQADLSWDADILPSVLLWYSNRGRAIAPWDNRHLCIGIEPIASPFGLSPDMARADNPISESGVQTCVPLDPSKPLTIHYRIAVSASGEK